MVNPMMSRGHMESQIFNNQLVRTLLEKNFELGSSHTEMAKGIVEFCRNLTSIIGPVLDQKEKENKRLKRLLKDRYSRGSDDDSELEPPPKRLKFPTDTAKPKQKTFVPPLAKEALPLKDTTGPSSHELEAPPPEEMFKSGTGRKSFVINEDLLQKAQQQFHDDELDLDAIFDKHKSTK